MMRNRIDHIVIKRFLLFLMFIGLAGIACGQYIPAFPTEKTSKAKKTSDQDYWHSGNMFQHMSLSLTAGITGIGLDVALPVCEMAQVRVGYEMMIPFQKKVKVPFLANGEVSRSYDANGNRVETPYDRIEESIYQEKHQDMENPVTLNGKMTMNNFKLLVDFYPFAYDKNWHFTTGVYWGPSQFAKIEGSQSDFSLQCMKEYNDKYDASPEGDPIRENGRLALCGGYYAEDIYVDGSVVHKKGEPYQMDLTSDGMVLIQAKSNSLKPYIGFGYGGRLIPKRSDWRVSFDCGILMWGGTPAQVTHDGTNLSKDVERVPGTLGHRVSCVEAFKVCSVLSVRFTKILF